MTVSRRWLLLLGLVGFVLGSVGALGAALPARTPVVETAVYVLRLQEAPLARYRGGLPGLPATMPQVGAARLDLDAAAASAYRTFLLARQASVEAALAALLNRPVEPHFRYQIAYNGLALRLTPAEAARAAALPGVADVLPAATYAPLTDAGPAFIGAPGIWEGSAPGVFTATRGAGILIGVIDTGIDADHPAFAAVGPLDGYAHVNPWGDGVFAGYCAVTDPTFCNDKLIGFWDFSGDGALATNNGHGTHVAAIAAGNYYTDVLAGSGVTITPTLSGVAPHASLVAYDACAGNSCRVDALLAAVEQALSDGVDVINYSIGGPSSDPWRNPITEAFLSARAAGVFVAAAAGNGADFGSINAGADAPWVLAVGNVRYDRVNSNALIDLSGGATTPPADMVGYGITGGYGPAPIVYAGDFNPANGACTTPFAPGTFSNVDGSAIPAIVVCDGGSNSGTAKLNNVVAGGAGALVGLLTDYWMYGANYTAAPAMRLHPDDGAALLAWLAAGSGHMGSLRGYARLVDPAYGDHVFTGSSRGMNPSVPGVIKPDVAAPGYAVRAAVNGGGTALYIGTSQASPHAAGAAALLMALYPGWSPDQIQSALMTTAVFATVTKEDWQTAADPFDIGGGRIDVSRAAAAGLLLNESAARYAEADPLRGGDPTTLNLASLGNNACVAQCAWTRTLQNALPLTTSWQVVISAPAGLTLTLPAGGDFTVGPGAAFDLQVTADVRGLPQGQWAFAHLLLRETGSQAPDVHLPLAVRPLVTNLPDALVLATRRDDGSEVLGGLRAPAAAPLTLTVQGLAPLLTQTFTLSQDPTPNPWDNLDDGTTRVLTLTVPGATSGLLVDLLAAGAWDVDLYVGRDDNGDGQVVESELRCQSSEIGIVERCRLADPQPGVYWILVQNSEASAAAPDAITLGTALLPSAAGGALTVTGPDQVPPADPFALRLRWALATSAPGSYAGLVVSGDPQAPWSHTWLRLDRLPDDVTVALSSPEVVLGESAALTLTVAPHPGWADAGYLITVTLPAGLTPQPGGGVTVDGQTATWQPLLLRDGPGAAAAFSILVNEIVCRQPQDTLLLPIQVVHTTTDPAAQAVALSAALTVRDLQAACGPYLIAASGAARAVISSAKGIIGCLALAIC